MISETQHTKTEKQLVPQLRFAEFDEDWQPHLMQDLTTRISDGIHSTPKYDEEGEYYFVNGNNLKNSKIEIFENTKKVSTEEYEKHKRELNANTILLSINGTIGNLAFYNNEKVLLGKSACYINLKSHVHKNLIYSLLETAKVQNYFTSELTGSTIKNLSLKTIKETKLFLPTNETEQQKIASFLTAVDTKLQQLTQKKELLQQYKKGVMQQLFSQQLRFKKEDGSDYPDWEEKELGEVSSEIGYGMNAAAIPFDGINKYIRITDIDESTRKFVPNPITSPNGDLIKKFLVQKGDILFARTGASVGKSYLHKEENSNLYFAGFLIRFSIKKGNPYFIYSQTCTSNFKKWVEIMSIRSGQPGINAEEYKSYKIKFPCFEEQQQIASYLSVLDTKIETVTQQIEITQQFKKGLLQQMFV